MSTHVHEPDVAEVRGQLATVYWVALPVKVVQQPVTERRHTVMLGHKHRVFWDRDTPA